MTCCELENGQPLSIEIAKSEESIDALVSFTQYILQTRHLNTMFQAKRRYSDFTLLVQYLSNTYPGVLVPVLPEKQMQVHLEYRIRRLGFFLNECALHPVIRHDHVLHLFLSSSVIFVTTQIFSD